MADQTKDTQRANDDIRDAREDQPTDANAREPESGQARSQPTGESGQQPTDQAGNQPTGQDQQGGFVGSQQEVSGDYLQGEKTDETAERQDNRSTDTEGSSENR